MIPGIRQLAASLAPRYEWTEHLVWAEPDFGGPAQTAKGSGAGHCRALGAKLLRESCLERRPAGSRPCSATHNSYGALGGECRSFTRSLSFQLLEAYKMTNRPCGVCLILNNHNFAKAREGVLEHKHMKDRNGTDVDAGTVNVKDEFAHL